MAPSTRTRSRNPVTSTKPDPEAWRIGLDFLEKDNDPGNLSRLEVHPDGSVTVRNRPVIRPAIVD